jgi:hypothetical protein
MFCVVACVYVRRRARRCRARIAFAREEYLLTGLFDDSHDVVVVDARSRCDESRAHETRGDARAR